MRIFWVPWTGFLRRAGSAPQRVVSCAALLAITALLSGQARIPDPHLPPRIAEARRFLSRRGLRPGAQNTRLRARSDAHFRDRAASIPVQPEGTAGTSAWQPLGLQNVLTPYYGAVTGRIASIAFDPSDATGNTVYLGTTGGSFSAWPPPRNQTPTILFPGQ